MKRALIALSLLATACTTAVTPLPEDCLLADGKPVAGVDVLVATEALPDYPGMTLRTVQFVNTTDADIRVDAMETSRIRLEGPEVWSLQPTSTAERMDWVLPVEKGFYQKNFLGMNNDDYGGGIPMVSVWTPDRNRSVGIVEPVLRLVSMPVSRKDDCTEVCIRQEFPEGFVLHPGDTLSAVRQFVLDGKGDFFAPLRSYAEYMKAEYGFSFPASPEEAYEPVWCAWGYERTFTVDEVIGTLPKVVELGFKWVDVDDGYQWCEGDWDANDRIGPDGMRRMTDAIHAAGLQAKLWWAPLAADPESQCAKEHPDILLARADGSREPISWWDSWYLSPVNEGTWKYTEDLVDMFLVDWGFDGFKLDGQHLNLSEPDYNPTSGLSRPEEACERHPEFFKTIYDRAQADKPGSIVQICPCGCAVNFYLLPYFNQAVASDPTSSAQIRQKRKVYAAIAPELAYYADHVELSDGGMDFASQVGVGGVIGSKFTWPKPNPDATQNGGSILTPEKEEALRKWVPLYSEKMLSKGTYLSLYDIAFDKPEAHVIAKDDALYYAFYAESWDGAPIELRGLEKGRSYAVTEYTDDIPTTYFITGDDPVIRPNFQGNYLIEVK